MKQAQGRGWRTTCSMAAGVILSICLTGCEIAGFTLPDLPNIDFDLSFLESLGGPSLGTTDPADALDALSTEAVVTSPTIREAGTLTVGVDMHTTLAPMVMFATDGSGVFGMDVDIAAALADELGLRVRFVSVEDSDSAAASDVDVVLSAADGDLELSSVVGVYADDALGFFYKGEATVVDVSALAGATVGVQPGSASKAALDHTTLGMATVDYTSLNEAFAALEAGEVQYVLCDAYAGAYLATGYDDIAFAGAINTPTVRGVAVGSSNVALQQAVRDALDVIQGNGVLDVIRQRWIGNLPALTSDQQIANIPLVEEKDEEAATVDETSDDGSDEEAE